MKLLASIDVESTGPNPATDAITSIGIVILGGPPLFLYREFKPWKPVSDEAAELTGLTNEYLANESPFSKFARELHDKWLAPYDLLGFNITGFDVQIIWEELYRCGIEWDLSQTLIVDPGTIWKKLEERTLEAACEKFLGEKFEGHQAHDDALQTSRVFNAMTKFFPSLGSMTRQQLHDYSIFDDRRTQVTMDGKIILDKDGDPAFNFGKAKGTKVADDLGFAYWILGKDFPAYTRRWLQKYLEEKCVFCPKRGKMRDNKQQLCDACAEKSKYEVAMKEGLEKSDDTEEQDTLFGD